MFLNQPQDRGSLKAEIADIRFELRDGIFGRENIWCNCVSKENTNPTNDFDKSMPATNLDIETVELLVSRLLSLCWIGSCVLNRC